MTFFDLMLIGAVINGSVWLWTSLTAVDTDMREQQRQREREEAAKHGIFL